MCIEGSSRVHGMEGQVPHQCVLVASGLQAPCCMPPGVNPSTRSVGVPGSASHDDFLISLVVEVATPSI